MRLLKRKANEHGHCQKILRRLWTTIWQRKAIWKTSFQTNPQELSTLCIYPKQLLKNTKNVSFKKTLSVSTLAQYPATSKEHPISNHDLDRVQCWKTRSGHVGTLTDIVPSAHSDVMVSFSEGAMSLKRTLLNGDRYAHCLTGAVLLQLSYPDRFDWSFSSTLQGARLESFL